MGLQTLMHRRGAVYYYRQRIPLELIPCIGKTELRLSLATTDAKEAVKRLRILSAHCPSHTPYPQCGYTSSSPAGHTHSTAVSKIS